MLKLAVPLAWKTLPIPPLAVALAPSFVSLEFSFFTASEISSLSVESSSCFDVV